MTAARTTAWAEYGPEGPMPRSVDFDALRARDPAAVALFVEDYQPAIRRLVARILAWSDDTPDLVQDIFATAIVALPRFRGESEIGTWLTRIAINRCRRHLRRQRIVGLFRRTSPKPDAVTSINVIDRAETNAAVRRAVAALPAKYREVVVLRYLEERSTQETAVLLDLRVNTVDVRLHRARSMLEAALACLMNE